MISVQCPLRVSLFGGGSDYPHFSRDHAGVVVGGTINKYLYVNVNSISAFARERFRLTYRVTESVNDIMEIEHPIVRTMLSDLKWKHPINIATMADVPGQTGLGSSSAFTVAMRVALAAFEGRHIAAKDLSDYALRLERVLLGEPGGIQDQLYPTHGGLRRFIVQGWNFSPSDPLLRGSSLEEFSRHFLLVFTGSTRESRELAQKTANAAIDPLRRQALEDIAVIAFEASEALISARTVQAAVDATVWGITESWAIKAALDPSIAPSSVKHAIEHGLNNGARAAKLLGAGGAGFILFAIGPEDHSKLVAAFPRGYVLPFAFVEQPVAVHDSLFPSTSNTINYGSSGSGSL